MAKKNPETNLTDQQEMFVRELIKCGSNATQAALNAGYSEANARQQGSRLLTNADIIAYKEKLMADVKKDSIADIHEILEYYTRVMRREEKESQVVVVKEKTIGMAKNPQTGKLERVTVEKETPQIVEIPTKVSDANKAAEMLGKNYGIWTEKVNVDTNQSITFVEDLEPDE